MSVRRIPRGQLLARAWQALCRGPFFIIGWLVLIPAVALTVIMVLSVILTLLAMVIAGEWSGLRILAGMLLSGTLQVLALVGILVCVLLVNDRLIYLAHPKWPRDPRTAPKRSKRISAVGAMKKTRR